jgi:hypothetical protein
MENMENNMNSEGNIAQQATQEEETNKGSKEMMTLPDGTVVDVTDKTPEEKREILNSYREN